MRDGGFDREAPNVAGVRVRFLLQRGELEEAAGVAAGVHVPLALAHLRLAKGDAEGTLAVLGPFRRQAEERGWADDRLRALVVEALAQHAMGATDQATATLVDAIRIAAPGGFVRLFLDEGAPMARLLRDAAGGSKSEHVARLLGAFRAESHRGSPVGAASAGPAGPSASAGGSAHGPVEPLTAREIELLALIADGLSNAEIAARLYLSPHTVKVHVRNIFAKLDAGSRTQAVAKARGLGLLGR